MLFSVVLDSESKNVRFPLKAQFLLLLLSACDEPTLIAQTGNPQLVQSRLTCIYLQVPQSTNFTIGFVALIQQSLQRECGHNLLKTIVTFSRPDFIP